MESKQQGEPAASSPDYELKAAISNATVLQLVAESQTVLQNLLANSAVFEELAVFYPKTYESIVQLVMAFEQLSTLLQELNVLHNVEQPPEEEDDGQAEKKQTAGPSKETKGKKRHKAVEGEERQVQIGGRSYRRVYRNGAWHYLSKQHEQGGPSTPQ